MATQQAAHKISADPIEAEAPLDLGACPFPRCELAAEHTGKHAVRSRPPSGAPAGDDDLDLLPAP